MSFLKDCMITTLIQSLHGTHYYNKLLSNHIDSDMNPVAIFQIYESNIHEKLLVWNPSQDIDIIVLFMQHCLGGNIFIDTSHSDARKIVDIRCPMLSETEYQRLSGMHVLSGKDYISSSFWKDKYTYYIYYIYLYILYIFYIIYIHIHIYIYIYIYICKFREIWSFIGRNLQEKK